MSTQNSEPLQFNLYYRNTRRRITVSEQIRTYGHLQSVVLNHLNLSLSRFRALLYNFEVVGVSLPLNQLFDRNVSNGNVDLQVIVNYIPRSISAPVQIFKDWLHNQVDPETGSFEHFRRSPINLALMSLYLNLLIPNPTQDLLQTYDILNTEETTNLSQEILDNSSISMPSSSMPSILNFLNTGSGISLPSSSGSGISNSGSGISNSGNLAPPEVSITSTVFQRDFIYLDDNHTSAQTPTLTDMIYYEYYPDNSNTQTNHTGSDFTNRTIQELIDIFLDGLDLNSDETIPDNLPPAHRVTLSTNDLEKFPTTSYNQIETLNPVSTSHNCTVCVQDYQENEVVRLLGCRHFFHQSCIDQWLTEYSVRCPICRADTRDYLLESGNFNSRNAELVPRSGNFNSRNAELVPQSGNFNSRNAELVPRSGNLNSRNTEPATDPGEQQTTQQRRTVRIRRRPPRNT